MNQRRIDFGPFPWHSHGGMDTDQLKRWAISRQRELQADSPSRFYLATDVRKVMQVNWVYARPGTHLQNYPIMGKTFDYNKLTSTIRQFFAIRGSAS